MLNIYEICFTMQFLHDENIIHLDFKTLNVILDDNCDICIAGFGLSRKIEDNMYMTFQDLENPLYIAPELFTDEYENCKNNIDVYSFYVSYIQYFRVLENLNDYIIKFRPPQKMMMRIGSEYSIYQT